MLGRRGCRYRHTVASLRRTDAPLFRMVRGDEIAAGPSDEVEHLLTIDRPDDAVGEAVVPPVKLGQFAVYAEGRRDLRTFLRRADIERHDVFVAVTVDELGRGHIGILQDLPLDQPESSEVDRQRVGKGKSV